MTIHSKSLTEEDLEEIKAWLIIETLSTEYKLAKKVAKLTLNDIDYISVYYRGKCIYFTSYIVVNKNRRYNHLEINDD